jgi:hypothetical protein
MPTTRISEEAREILRKLSDEENCTMQKIIEKALEEYRRKQFLEKSNRAYARLRQNQQEWQEEKREREAWNNTQSDGLDEDEY